MIELNLKKLAAEMIWSLEILAVVQKTCERHGIESTWCLEREGEIADLLGRITRIMELRGDVMQIRKKGGGKPGDNGQE